VLIVLNQGEVWCCRQYAAIVFIENIRFDLSRKKLAYLTFVDFVYCSNLMLSHWSHGLQGQSPIAIIVHACYLCHNLYRILAEYYNCFELGETVVAES